MDNLRTDYLAALARGVVTLTLKGPDQEATVRVPRVAWEILAAAIEADGEGLDGFIFGSCAAALNGPEGDALAPRGRYSKEEIEDAADSFEAGLARSRRTHAARPALQRSC